MRNMTIRVAKTFVATFLGTLGVLIPTIDFSKSDGVMMTLAIALASSLITAIMNIPKIKEFLNHYGETPESVTEKIMGDILDSAVDAEYFEKLGEENKNDYLLVNEQLEELGVD